MTQASALVLKPSPRSRRIPVHETPGSKQLSWSQRPRLSDSATPMKSVTIFCDGSSLGNGQTSTRAAAVALLGFKGVWRAVGEDLGHATNQQAEVTAAGLGLGGLTEPRRGQRFTDSRFVLR